MSSSGRLTRTVVLVKSRDKTEDSLSCIGWSLMRDAGRTGKELLLHQDKNPGFIYQ